MICCTSYGSLIAYTISLKYFESNIFHIYTNKSEKNFSEQKKTWLLYFGKLDHGFVKLIIIGGEFSNVDLKEVLNEIFGDKLIEDCENLLYIPSYSMTQAKTTVFKHEHSNLSKKNKTTIIHVALAISTAPKYFPLAESVIFNNAQFVDVEIWANKPILVGLLKALKYIVGTNKMCKTTEVFSSISLTKYGGKKTGLKKSLFDWKGYLFVTVINVQNFFSFY